VILNLNGHSEGTAGAAVEMPVLAKISMKATLAGLLWVARLALSENTKCNTATSSETTVTTGVVIISLSAFALAEDPPEGE